MVKLRIVIQNRRTQIQPLSPSTIKNYLCVIPYCESVCIQVLLLVFVGYRKQQGCVFFTTPLFLSNRVGGKLHKAFLDGSLSLIKQAVDDRHHNQCERRTAE